uniref:hypothetical protein n=1 Tax=Chromobacterium haemolyticum TaxID=394935 RepID=UPI001965988A
WSGGNMLSAVQSARDVHAGLQTLFKVSRARARQGENERKSGVYEGYMSILSLYSPCNASTKRSRL